MLTKLLKTIFLTGIMFACFTVNVSATQADRQNWDAVLDEFIHDNIPDSELTNSNFSSHAVQLLDTSNGRIEMINEKINFSVYTFKRTDNTEPKYDTVIDYHFKEPMKVKRQDRLEVQISNHLRPVTPMKSVMLTRNAQNDNWEFFKEATPVMNSLQSFTLEGDELSNSESYSRVIIHFTSHSNPAFTEDDVPEYNLHYLHDPSFYLFFTEGQAISFLAICFLGLLFILNRRQRVNDTK